MRSGRLHVAGVNTGGNPVAVSCSGFVPFAMMASEDGSFGYEMEIIVPADSPIQSPADLRRLPRESLAQVTGELRGEIVERVSRTGGHLASSLGAVELLTAIHYVFDTYGQANVTGLAAVKSGLDSWYFLTADYAFGQDLEKDTSAVVTKTGKQVN